MLPAAGYGVLPVGEVAPDQLAAFDCGKPRLNDFLAATACRMHMVRLSFTSVVFHRDSQGPVAYFTLSNDSIPLTDSEKFELDLADTGLSSFPAVKIGRLAVRGDLQGAGVGKYVVSQLILGTVVGSDAFSAARFIVLDADNEPDVLGFYRRLGFDESLWAERNALKAHRGRRAATAQRKTIKMHRDILKP